MKLSDIDEFVRDRMVDDILTINESEIELLEARTHPLQTHLAKKFDLPLAEIFALPQPYMRALHEIKISHKEGTGKYGKGFATAILRISQEDPWFWSHFVGDPIMPGTQGTDGFYQLGASWAGSTGLVKGRGRALAGSFKYNGQILPTNKVIYYHLDIVKFLKKRALVFFEGHISVDTQENIIYQYRDCQLGFFSAAELSLPSIHCEDYYNPDWEKVKSTTLSWIDANMSYLDGIKND